MLLRDELELLRARLAGAPRPLRGDVEAPLAVVLGEHPVLAQIGHATARHGFIVPARSAGARPRGEAAEVGRGASAGGLDGEAGGLHRPTALAVRTAAAREPPPC